MQAATNDEAVLSHDDTHPNADATRSSRPEINHHTRVGSHCFFAPGAVVAGDAEIGEGCFVGAGAIVRDRVTVGPGCVIGAGAVIMADCAAGGVYRATRTERTRERED